MILLACVMWKFHMNFKKYTHTVELLLKHSQVKFYSIVYRIYTFL